MGNLYHMLKSEPTSKFHQFALLSLFVHMLLLSPKTVTSQQGDGVIITIFDFQILLAVKREFIDARGTLKSWNGTRNGACSGSWAGIKCVKGRVVAIQIPFKGLGGRISLKVGLLKQLRKLSLHDNLIGGSIPSTIGSLPNLKGLYLFNNRLSGSIPPSIGQSSQIQAIDLGNNLLSGFIPPTIVNSPRIYRLNLSFNSLSGPIFPAILISSSLTLLALEHNNLSGSIPDSWGSSSRKGSNGVYRLRSLNLGYNSLSGTIPHSVGKLGNLVELSFSHNRLYGTMPDELSNLLRLKVLDLSNNGINGSFSKGFDGLKNLSVLNLRANHLEGPVPSTIGNLFSIALLDLSQNNFSGEIPASLDNLSNLTSFNVSYNALSGQVPSHLAKEFNSSSFVGNLQLCGFSASTPCFFPAPLSQGPSGSFEAKPHHHRKLSTKDIILIVVGTLLAILLVLCCVLLCCLISKRAGSKAKNGLSTEIEKGVVTEGGAGAEAGGKLVLFDGSCVFTADDLLCATAEIMGKSPYGTVYKATLDDGNQVTVKRLREKLAKNPKEFELEVTALGRIRHPNLLPLRAYYLGPKREKLLVFDYLPKGSLSSFLHARGPEIAIDWPTRMKIAMGVTRGLKHLHIQENLVHGNLTSSDVYLDEQNNPKICDYGIHRLMTDSANTNVIATAGSTGYHPPELQKTKKATMKTDIYSLGVIILELLTGKSPGEAIDGSDLPQWVASTVKEEWTNEVFDLELMRDASITGDEMLNTLKLALCLVDSSPDARPEAQEVLQQLQEITNPNQTVEATEEFTGKTHH